MYQEKTGEVLMQEPFGPDDVGMKVWNPELGFGKIVKWHEDYFYPVEVLFKNGAIDGFTNDGRLTDLEQPSLFRQGDTIHIPVEPRPKVKKTLSGYLNLYPDAGPCFILKNRKPILTAPRIG
jgi:hypothetical protein